MKGLMSRVLQLHTGCSVSSSNGTQVRVEELLPKQLQAQDSAVGRTLPHALISCSRLALWHATGGSGFSSLQRAAQIRYKHSHLSIISPSQGFEAENMCDHQPTWPHMKFGPLYCAADEPRFSKGAYALGKMVYGKGWDELVDLLAQDSRGSRALVDVQVDCYGYGEAQPRVSSWCL